MIDLTYIVEHPLASLLVTLCSFSVFRHLQQKYNGHALLNPVPWSIALSALYISISGINYDIYMRGGQYINFLLGPVTVALAVQLFKNIKEISKDAFAIGLTIFTFCPLAGFSAWFITVLAQAPSDIQLAMIPKSTTTPIAIEIAEKIHAIPSLAVLFVIITGVSGSILATSFFKLLRIKNEKAQGLAIGIASHGIGAARAFDISQTAGTYAIIGMSLMGLLSGIMLPLLIFWFI